MPAETTTTQIADMHVHADFFAAATDVPCLCTTVSPARYLEAEKHLPRVALGLHPWWLVEGVCGEEDVSAFEQLAPDSSLIGEIGLDFFREFASSAAEQQAAFERLCAALADGKRRFISLHVRKAEQTLLDILEEQGLTQSSICCLHHFSGSSDALARAIGLGCMFSVSERTLAAKKWHEYAKLVPDAQLLLETDFPPGRIEALVSDSLSTAAPLSPDRQIAVSSDEHVQTLENALTMLEAFKGRPLRAQIIDNQTRVLKL